VVWVVWMVWVAARCGWGRKWIDWVGQDWMGSVWVRMGGAGVEPCVVW